MQQLAAAARMALPLIDIDLGQAEPSVEGPPLPAQGRLPASLRAP